MVIPDRAAKLYERTWDRFNEMLSFIPTMTLRSLCRDSRVNYCGMQEWMAQHGYAEPERADTGKGRASDPIGTSEENPTFLQLNPVSLPQSIAHDILRQVSITFSEGTVLMLQECSPEGVVSLLDTYARRRSAMEGACKDCDDELEAIELRGDDVDQSVVDLYGAGAAGTSGSDVATRNVGASGSNGVQSQGSDKLQKSRASQDMLSKLAQAQLTINKCDMLIAKQALRIDELERVLRKFIQ